MSMRREDLNGAWILDKTQENWSMNNYLRVMNVDPVAVEAHEKGEMEFDTIHTITMDSTKVKIVKRSRVNNDVTVELVLGEEQLITLPPGDRPKRSLATSDDPGQLRIVHSLQTYNGAKASVSDSKILRQEEDKSVIVQELSIVNEVTREQCTTVRKFIPYLKTPPHLEDEGNA